MDNSIIKQKITTDLSAEPVSLAEVKTFANITYTDYDSLLTLMVKTARQQLQAYCSKAFGVATIDTQFYHTGCQPITLPFGWFGEVTALEYRCSRLSDWATVSLDETSWEVEDGQFMAYRGYWRMTYTTEAITVSETIKTAIKAQAVYLWENRANEQKPGYICSMAQSLINSLVDGGLLL